MEIRSRFLLLFLLVGVASALVPSETINPAAPKAISDLRDAIVKGLGFQEDGMKVSGFDVQDALVGQSMAYEFDIEVDKKIIPLRLLEDVSRWDFADLPIFRPDGAEEDGKLVAERGKGSGGKVVPVLPPFQLAGPMELWIQDGDDMRLALPHDVDAGTLKKVMLLDGAVVTVKGAKSVNLRHPLELPLPLNLTQQEGRPVASSLLTIAEALRQASRNTEKPLLSLRIVGATSLTSSPSASPSDKLKLKRLAPGLVELSSRTVPAVTEDVDQSPLHENTLWPFTSLNGSDRNLRGFEDLLASVLGKKGGEEGSFKLVKADVSARTYVKMGFSVEKRLLDGDVDWKEFPEWKTKPETVKSHFEVLARIEESGKVIPERIAEVKPFNVQESFAPSVLTGNVTMSQMPVVHPPPVYFTL